MIKRFKFLVIIFILNIDSVINCSGFERDLHGAISSKIDFGNLTREQEYCYLPQIHKKGIAYMPIDYACSCSKVSAFKWLLSKGVVPTKECFEKAILSSYPKSEIVSELLIRGCYTQLGQTKTLLITPLFQDKLVLFSELATKYPDSFASSLAEVQKIYVMIKRYEDEVGLRTAWNAAVMSAGANYAGAGSGVDIYRDCVR